MALNRFQNPVTGRGSVGGQPTGGHFAAAFAGTPSLLVPQGRRPSICGPDEPCELLVPEPAPSPDIEFERVGRAGVRFVKAASLQQLVNWLTYFVSTTDQARRAQVLDAAC